MRGEHAAIVLDGVSKRFGAPPRGTAAPPWVLERVSMVVEQGEIVVLVGPSGCGKSTTLRMVAGLEQPDSGSVSIAGRSMAGVPPRERDVAMVFQGYALYPQMTARQNIEFPLKMRGVARAEREKAVDEAAATLRIERLLDRRPGELSGGERQRVAMGRAMVRKPRVFLFDEPLSSLDASLRADLRLEIAQLVRGLGATALYVTHDHAEAMTLGDRLAVMRAGRLLQIASPQEVYERPATSFVGAFVGSPRMNLLPARLEGDVIVAGAFRFARPVDRPMPARLQVGVRPEHVVLDEDAGEGGQGGEGGEVLEVEPLGAESHIRIRVGDCELRARSAGFDGRRRGDRVRVAIPPERALVFDAQGDGARLA